MGIISKKKDVAEPKTRETYPVLRTFVHDGSVVLFTDRTSGVKVHSGNSGSYTKGTEIDQIGYHSRNWSDAYGLSYGPYDGEIILKND